MSKIELYTQDLLDGNSSQVYLNIDEFIMRMNAQVEGKPGLLKQSSEKYQSLQPLTIDQFEILSQRYRIAPEVLHVISMQQAGIAPESGSILWGKLNENLFPSLPDIDIKPEAYPNVPWTLKSFFAAPVDKTPYSMEGNIITFWGTDTGIRTRKSGLKQRQYTYPGKHYVYTETPCAVTVNPVDNPCEESCQFCPVSYTRKSSLYQGGVLHRRNPNTHVSQPEEVINQLVKDTGIPPLSEIDRLAVVTAKFPEDLQERDTYPAYSARLVNEAKTYGFNGALFMLAASTPDDIAKYSKYSNSATPSIYAHTLEVYDDQRRKKLMPGDKGNNTFQGARDTVIAARDVFTKTGFFYIAGIENKTSSMQFLSEVSQMDGVLPWVHALNPYGPGIMHTMDQQNVAERIEDLLIIQRELINRFGPVVSYNLYSLVPHGSKVDSAGDLVYG